MLVIATGFVGAQQLAECDFAFPPNNKVHHSAGVIGVCVDGQTRIITAHDDLNAWSKRAHQVDDLLCCFALKSHHRKSHHIGIQLPHQFLDRLTDTPLNQDKVSNSNLVMWINISSQRRQSSVGHADTHCRHVLEGIRHGKQQNVHGHPIVG